MARKPKLPTRANQDRVESENPPVTYWPAEFAPLRQTLAIAACLLAWGAILATLASGNDLLGLKKALLILAGARMEPVLGLASLQSVDIAVVLFSFLLVAGAGYIHVSAGLAVLLVLRPWLDGFTYPTDNFYFLWAILGLSALWALRHLRNPKPIRGLLPLGLLALFWLTGAISLVSTWQYDTTFRELLLLTGYWFTLFLAINATGTPVARGLVLLGFLAGVSGQALFAYPHLWYILPWLRDYLQEDPRRLAQWFKGATEFTPELARRFNLNRAFASMVFPNALAALLILGIPVVLALAWNGRTAFRSSVGSATPEGPIQFRVLLPWGGLLFASLAIPLYLLGQMPLTYRIDGAPWFGNAQNLALLSVAVAAPCTLAFLLGARKWGLYRAATMLGAAVAMLLCPVLLGALWITYSRGAMLALAAACLFGLVLLCFRRRILDRIFPVALTAALLLLALPAFLSAASVGAQSTTSEAAATPSVSGEGMDITVRELADPGSFRLRLGYWKVAWYIGLDHPYTGVGLGNFRMAYGPYQYLGAGDVQNAHNALLQAQCETGVSGFLALSGFWVCIVISGVITFRRASDAARKTMHLGILCGLLAFLLHSMLDINFSHPSLLMFFMVLAGLHFSFAAEPLPSTRSTSRYVAVPLLLLAALAGGMAFRPFLLDLGTNGGRFINVGNRSMNEARQNAAQFFLADCTAWARDGKIPPPPVLPIADTVSLLPDREVLFQVGRVLAPDQARQRLVPLAKESALPPDAVFQIARPWNAHFYAFESVETWLAELERLDAHFPHDPQSAYVIGNTYKLLVDHLSPARAAMKSQLLPKMLGWAEEAVRRSPFHKDMYQALAWAHWDYGMNTTGAESLGHFEKAMAAFKRSSQLGHLEPRYRFAYAEALGALGQSYKNAGQDEASERYLKDAASERAWGERLQRQRWDLGLQ